MRVLLVQPPVEDFYTTEIRLQPLGLAFIKAAIKSNLPDVEVRIVDFQSGWGRRTIPVPQELQYLKPFYGFKDSSPFSTFHQFYRFGASNEEIKNEIKKFKPDLVGISSLFTPYYREALSVAAIAKELGATTVMGGGHVSACPDFTLSFPQIDFIILGAGERPFWQLLKALIEETDYSGIPGIRYRSQSSEPGNKETGSDNADPDLIPDFSDFPLNRYRIGKKSIAFLLSSRGCPHQCSFCSVHAVFGKGYSRRSIASILEEIHLRYLQGYRIIDFEDDNFTFFKREAKELLVRLIEQPWAKELELVAMNGISYLSLDEELLDLMGRAGFSTLNLSLVSSDESVLETVKRPHTLKKYLEVVRSATAKKFSITSYQILGLPHESLESMIDTLVVNARLPVLLGASPFYQIPGTIIAEAKSLMADDYFRARLTALAIETPFVNRKQLYTLLVTTRIFNFLKGLKGISDLAEAWLSSDPSEKSTALTREREALLELRDLYHTGEFIHQRAGDFFKRTEFDSELYFKIAEKVSFVCTLEGEKILIDPRSLLRDSPSTALTREPLLVL